MFEVKSLEGNIFEGFENEVACDFEHGEEIIPCGDNKYSIKAPVFSGLEKICESVFIKRYPIYTKEELADELFLRKEGTIYINNLAQIEGE